MLPPLCVHLRLRVGFALFLLAAITTANSQAGATITAQPQPTNCLVGTMAKFSVTATGTGSLTYAWFHNNITVTNGGRISGATNTLLTISNVVFTDPGNYFVQVSNSQGVAVSSNALLQLYSVPLFTEVTNTGLIPLSLGTAAWGDFNNDGRLDILISGKDTNDVPQVKIFRNDGGGVFTDIGANFDGLFGGAVAWGDYDNDGYLDVLVNGYNSGSYGFGQIYHNLGNGTFTNVASYFNWASSPVTLRMGAVAWADYDNDGRIDPLFLGVGDQIFHNEGTNGFAGKDFGLSYPFWVGAAWGDYDNDGFPDLATAGRMVNNVTDLRHNDQGQGFSSVPHSLPLVQGGSLAWSDYDNDGDLDLAIQGWNESAGWLTQVYRNNGSGAFTLMATNLPGGYLSSVAWGDYDNDGRQDLLIGTPNGTYTARNRGNGTFDDPVLIAAPCYNGVAVWGDYDNDGRLDILVMGGTPGAYVAKIYHNNSVVTNTLPAAPAGLNASAAGNTATFNWTAATDSPQTFGLSYNLRVGTTPGGANIVNPMAATNGLRRLPAIGNAWLRTTRSITNLGAGTYYWSVQAVDHSFAGSAFAIEQSITLSAPAIAIQPQSRTNMAGSTATLTVAATGTGPLSYQWLYNGSALTNTTTNLTLANVQLAAAGGYSVIVGNAFGSVTSSVAVLTVVSPPTITLQPHNQTNAVGNPSTFTAGAAGTDPLTYQWYFNGTALTNDTHISGALDTSLNLTSDSLADIGSYWLVVTNPFGATTSSVVTLEVVPPPSITLQPTGQTNLTGSNVTFTVTAYGNLPLTYQWQFNGVNLTDSAHISGATNDALSVLNLTLGDIGNYTVVISNAGGGVTSSIASLTVWQLPVFTLSPTNQTGVVGYFASFSAAATGTGPLTYQWLFAGSPLTNNARITGANSTTLNLTGLTANDAGNYQLVATSFLGSTTSSVAVLTVVPPTCTPITNGLVGWWPAEGNAYDNFGTNDGTLAGGATFTNGMVGQGFRLDGNSGYVQIPDSAALKPVNVTVEAWVWLDPNASPGTEVIIFKRNSWTYLFEGYNLAKEHIGNGDGTFTDRFSFVITSGGNQVITRSLTVAQRGVWYHVAGSYDGNKATIWVNGFAEASSIAGFTLDYGTRPIFIGTTGEPAPYVDMLAGIIDEPAIYNRALSTNEILSLYTAGSLGKCPLPPRIIQSPTSVLTTVGTNITFTGLVASSLPLTYQWYFNDQPLTNNSNYAGADTASLTVTNAQTNDTGAYYFAVGNSVGSVNSAVAQLSLLYPPTIVVPPASQGAYSGSNVSFHVVVAGDGPFGYQWRLNGSILADSPVFLSGLGTDTLTISNLDLIFTGNYDVVVTNVVGTVVSPAATLTVYAAPKIVSQSGSRGVALGLQLSNSVVVSGTAPLAYQWSRDGVDLPDATNAAYIVSATTTNDYGTYVAIITNTFGAVTSAPIIISPTMVVAWGNNLNGQTNVPLGLTNIIAISSGVGAYTAPAGSPSSHCLALRADGTVFAWGYNNNGQTNVPPDATNIVAIAAGGIHSLALRADGTVTAWGANSSGQTNVPTNLSNVVAIAAGSAHSVALRADGKVFAWGSTSSGQTTVPVTLTKVVSIAAGVSHTLAVRADGTVVAFGNTAGDNQSPPGPTPAPAGLNDAISMAGGYFHSLALRSNGTVTAWGSTNYNKLIIPSELTNTAGVSAGTYFNLALRANGLVSAWGRGEYGQTNVPTGLSNVVAIAAGSSHALALVNDGRPLLIRLPVGGTDWQSRSHTFSAQVTGNAPLAYQWQFNGADIPGATNVSLSFASLDVTNSGTYQLLVTNALGATASVPVPLTVVSNDVLTFLSNLPTLSSNYVGGKLWLNVTVAGNGPLRYQWRFNNVNIPGTTNDDLVIEPLVLSNGGNYSVIVTNLTAVLQNLTSISSSQRVSLVRTWGYLATDPTANITNTTAIAAGYSGPGSSSGYYWSLRSDGKLAGWGFSSYGENIIPAAVSNATVTAIAAGYQHSLALRSDSTVVDWGYPYYGSQNVPAAANNIVAIACGDYHDMALRSDGTVVVWGGLSGTISNAVGAIPASVTNVVAIAGGSTHCMALRTDGRVVCWGSGSAQTNTPANLSNVVAIAAGAGSATSYALTADGTVTNWGADKASIPLDWTNIVAISAGYRHITGLRADGTVTTAGFAYTGNLAVPAGTENVIALATGGDHDVALFGPRTPAITVHPFSQTAFRGSNVTLHARAVSPVTVSYQWLFSGAPIANATNWSLTLTNLQFAQSGAYQLFVSNRYGTATSKAAKLAVTIPLPEALDTTGQQGLTLLVWSSTGGAQWFGQTNVTHDGVDAARSGDISHGQETILTTTTNYFVGAPLPPNSSQIAFWWKVSSESGFDTLEFRRNGTVLATISGEVDWERRVFPLVSGTNLLQWRYSKDFSGSAGQDAAWVDQVTLVPNAPVITGQPASQTVNAGSNATFGISVNSFGQTGFRWLHNLTNQVGVSSSALVLNPVTRANRGTYSCIVSNAGGMTASSNATLTVLAPQLLTAPAAIQGGGFAFNSQDADGGLLTEADLPNFEVRASDDLTNWITISNVLSLTNGTLLLRDSDATNHPAHFYQLIEH